MKLIMENWRNFLKEEQKTKVAIPKTAPEKDEYSAPYKSEYEDPDEYSREKHFGKNPENIPCIETLRNPKAILDNFKDLDRDLEKCMSKHGYKLLGQGSFRTVYSVPDNPNLVLKTVPPRVMLENPLLMGAGMKRSMEMNRSEAQGEFQTKSDLAPKVYDSARDYFWIKSEKVTPIETWKGMMEYFPIYQELIDQGKVMSWDGEGFKDFFYELIDPKRGPKTDPKNDWVYQYVLAELQKKYGTEDVEEPVVEKETAAIVKKLSNRSMFSKIKDVLIEFNLPAWDIRPHNVGYAVRGGKKEFVILDPGFELGKKKGTVKDDPRNRPSKEDSVGSVNPLGDTLPSLSLIHI